MSLHISGQTVEIHHPYSEKDFLCPGDQVIFTCRTTGSQTLEWRSNEYTDPNHHLKFASYDHVGGVLLSPNHQDVSANLTNSSRDDDGVIVMESELHIHVRSNASTFSVNCLLDNLETDMITLRVLGMCICI
jgi:hypothetical protein